MRDEEDMEDEGPSVDSTLQDERIAARRLRIQRRIETAKRDALGDDALLEKSSDAEKELRKSRKQIEESFQRLVKLQSDGVELVSNVQVAVDAREAARRIEDDENKRQRTEKLEAEAKAAITKFDEITSKWEIALSKETPQELNIVFEEQKTACDGMIDEKNKLINDLQLDLKSKDDRYVKDLRRQAEDVDLMIERMEEQVKTLLRAYYDELLQIEKAFDTERRDLLDAQKKRKDALEKQRQDREVEYLLSREKRVDDLDKQLQTLRTQDAEEYNVVKIKLETDVQILEQNLQQMKATYQLNQEKLEYNFQVLKKRDEENTITKSQQKRKITRLQDLLNNLKQKLKRQEKQYSDDNNSLTDDLRRITEQYKELQKKFRHFQATDNKKFNDIWVMNQDQAVDLAKNLMDEDKIIHEQQLGLPWDTPNVDFMKKKGPLQSRKSKLRSATDLAQEVLSTGNPSRHGSVSSKGADSESRNTVIEEGSEDPQSNSEYQEDYLTSDSIRQMLELLCNESGFLVESKLMKLLAPLDKEEQSLMKLDAIFSALGIDTEDDIYLLGRYFFAFTKNESSLDDTGPLSKSATNDEARPSVEDIKATLIDANDVFKALRHFAEEHKEPFRVARKQSMKFGVRAFRDASQDEAYWKQYEGIITNKQERVWDALTDGFEKYSQVLTERATLIQETDALKRQNSELRLLLRQYLNSRVNQELEIPPTRVLQFEASRE